MSRARITAPLASLAAACLLFAASPAFAQEEPAKAPAQDDQTKAPSPRFGDAGQFALSLNEGFAVNASDIVAGNQLQANYFIAPHLSLGLMIGAQWVSSSILGGASDHGFLFRVGPRVGYDIAFSNYVSFWPQIGFDYRRDEETPNNVGGSSVSPAPPSTTANALGLTIIAPILIHPTRGFFVGAGPSLYTEVMDSSNTAGNSIDNDKVTAFGLMAMIGGAI